MGLYNEVRARLTGPSCGKEVEADVQFEYGSVVHHLYGLGDKLVWSANDVGRPGRTLVVADGEAMNCPACGYDSDWRLPTSPSSTTSFARSGPRRATTTSCQRPRPSSSFATEVFASMSSAQRVRIRPSPAPRQSPALSPGMSAVQRSAGSSRTIASAGASARISRSEGSLTPDGSRPASEVITSSRPSTGASRHATPQQGAKKTRWPLALDRSTTTPPKPGDAGHSATK